LNQCLAQARLCPGSGLAAPPGLDPLCIVEAKALPVRSHIFASGPSSSHEAFALNEPKEENSAPPGLEPPGIAEANAMPMRSQISTSGSSSLHEAFAFHEEKDSMPGRASLHEAFAFHEEENTVRGPSSLHEARAFHEEDTVPEIAKTLSAEGGGFLTPRTTCPSSRNSTPAITPQPKMKCPPHFNRSCGQDGLRHCQDFSSVSVDSALVDSNLPPPLGSLAECSQVCEFISSSAPPGLGCLGSVEEDHTEGKISLASVGHLPTRSVHKIAESMEHGFVQRKLPLMAASSSELEVQLLALGAAVEQGFAKDNPVWVWECHGRVQVRPSPCAAPGEYLQHVASSPAMPSMPVPPLPSSQFRSSLPSGPVAPPCTMPAPFSSVPGAAASQYTDSKQQGMSIVSNSMERVSSHTRIWNKQGSNRTSRTAPALQQGFTTGLCALKKARAMLPAVDPKLLPLSRRKAQ